MPFPLLFEFAGFLLGLLFGSFLNVCISRLPHHESIATPRSHCPVCGHTIRWFDNIPLVSYLLLRGRCRDCKRAIPWRYPAVELAVGLWFFFAGFRLWNAWWVHGFLTVQRSAEDAFFLTLGVISVATLGFLLIGLIVMDWQTHRLPDAFTLTGTAIALFLVCTQAIFLGPTEAQINLTNHHIRMSSPGSMAEQGNVFLTGPEHLIFGRLLAVAAVALGLLVIRSVYKLLRHREGLGLGDVKMLSMIAAFLGFWPAVLTLFLATLLASVYAAVLLVRRRANSLTRIPLGSFLGIAGLIAAQFGNEIITRYTALLQ